jgi:hypothetical protein
LSVVASLFYGIAPAVMAVITLAAVKFQFGADLRAMSSSYPAAIGTVLRAADADCAAELVKADSVGMPTTKVRR